MKVKCDYFVERETDRAVFVELKTGECTNTTKYKWFPKTLCDIEEFVQTVDPVTNTPKSYGKRIVAIEQWLLFH